MSNTLIITDFTNIVERYIELYESRHEVFFRTKSGDITLSHVCSLLYLFFVIQPIYFYKSPKLPKVINYIADHDDNDEQAYRNVNFLESVLMSENLDLIEATTRAVLRIKGANKYDYVRDHIFIYKPDALFHMVLRGVFPNDDDIIKVAERRLSFDTPLDVLYPLTQEQIQELGGHPVLQNFAGDK